MPDYKLNHLQSWAGFTAGAVSPAIAETVLQEVKAGGHNLPIEWRSVSKFGNLIVLDQTRRLYQRDKALHPDLIHDVFWWDWKTGKWETTWVQWHVLWNGSGHPRRNTKSLCI